MDPLKTVLGITNKTKDGFYIPFLDYDNIPLDLVIKDIKNIQEIFKLGEAFIISSTNGFNVFFLDKLKKEICLKILEKCQYIDKQFLKYAKLKNNITLRLGNDKLFCINISSKYNHNILSNSHYEVFCKILKCDIFFSYYKEYEKNNYIFDGLNDFEFVLFKSKKYGFIEGE